jgi:hypothetical protein
MAAVVTQHPARDAHYVSLGFPSNFSEYYAKHGAPLEYFGSPLRATAPEMSGDSVQDQYHQQKMRDAHYMVMAGVKATAASKKHMESFHANYDMPKLVLGQRQFANPSYGSGAADIYPARKWSDVLGHDSSDEEMEGGVRTAKGQAWAFRKLQQRADQIQGMKDSPERFTSYMAPEFAALKEEALASQGIAEVAGPKLYLELAGLLNTVTASIQTGDFDKIVLADLFKMLKILFRVGASANREELGDLLAVVNENLEAIRGLEDLVVRPPPAMRGRDRALYNSAVRNKAFLYTLEILLGQTHEYLTRMLGAVDKSPKERKAASRAAIRNLQFTRPLGERDIGNTGAIGLPKFRRQDTEADNAALEGIPELKKNIADYKSMIRNRKRTEDKVDELEAKKVGKTARIQISIQARIDKYQEILDEYDDLETRIGMSLEDKLTQMESELVDLQRSGKRILPTVEVDALGRGHPVTTGGSSHIRSQLSAMLMDKPEEDHGARLTKDPRSTWAARSGAYYGEALPGYPDAFVSRNGRRAPKEAGLPTTAPVQATPVFSNKK